MTRQEKRVLKKERKRLKKQKKKNKGRSVQELFGIKTFTKNGLKVGKHTLVFFSVAPTNVSVLSYENIDLKIQRLMMVLSAVPDIEISCTDAAESFDTNKAYLLKRIDKEENRKVKKILNQDLKFVDNINLETSTARQFMFIVRCKSNSEDQVATIANRVEKIITEQHFDIKRLSKDEIKRFMAVYFDASLNGELIPDYDGIQYLKEEEDE